MVENREIVVDPLYTAEVAFTFQGTEFTDEVDFAPVDGEMRWFTSCG